MEKKEILVISFAVIALAVFLITDSFTESVTGDVVNNILDCVDVDGDNPGIKGHVIGSFTPQRPSNDFCVNSTTVGEYYCDKSRSDGKLKEVFCEFGCDKGACKISEGIVKEEPATCKQGCLYVDECLDVGIRVDGRYCDFTNSLKVQKEGECENNYECKSNLCLSGECLSEDGGKNFLKDVENTYFWE